MTPQVQLAIGSEVPGRITLANELATKLQITLTTLNPEQLQLVVTDNVVEIRAPGLGKPIFIDFVAGKNAHRRQFGGGRGQPLAKAVGLKKGATPTIIDVTAGFARDGFVLANLGCPITLVERNPLIATLIEDALNRAQEDDDIADIISRMTITNDDAVNFLNNLNEQQRPEVIYMDPMYPSREKSALVKKDMRLLHQLAGPDTDSEQLLTTARNTALKRVVVKRPKSAPFVGDQKPATSIESKNTRYDIYLT
ncbi:16S rRNA methyltransferase [Methylophaga sp. 41_12_T18]|nr:16S rRNA methyltransferase [Methylophaga sp. 41_12_T18]